MSFLEIKLINSILNFAIISMHDFNVYKKKLLICTSLFIIKRSCKR